MNMPVKPIIQQPGTGQYLHAFGNTLSVMLGAKQTSNSISIMMETTLPGGGPPLHMHSREDEIFLVLEGRISYLVDETWTEVGVGGVVYLPRGVAHCYKNIGAAPSRHWIITMPSGFEDFFASCAAEFAKSENPDAGRIIEIHREYGIELLER